MIQGDLRKLRHAAAADIVAGVELGAGARALLAGHAQPGAFLSALVEARLWLDAVRFLAFALPNREGVWWACLMARDTLPLDAPAGWLPCLEAAEAWVYTPSDEARRAVFPLAEAIGFESPAAYAGLAAFWSGGSLAPVGAPEVAPSPLLCPTAVGAAVLLSAVLRDPAKAEQRYRAAIAAGVDIANGGNGRGNAKQR